MHFYFAALFLSGRSDWGKKKKKIKDIARLFIGQKSKTGLWECDRKYSNVVLLFFFLNQSMMFSLCQELKGCSSSKLLLDLCKDKVKFQQEKKIEKIEEDKKIIELELIGIYFVKMYHCSVCYFIHGFDACMFLRNNETPIELFRLKVKSPFYNHVIMWQSLIFSTVQT